MDHCSGCVYLPRPEYHEWLRADHLLETFGERFSFILGNSKDAIGEVDLHTFDFVHIDGGHGPETFIFEIDWFCKNAKSSTRVLVDDVYVSYIHERLDTHISAGELQYLSCGFPSSGENRLFVKL